MFIFDASTFFLFISIYNFFTIVAMINGNYYRMINIGIYTVQIYYISLYGLLPEEDFSLNNFGHVPHCGCQL